MAARNYLNKISEVLAISNFINNYLAHWQLYFLTERMKGCDQKIVTWCAMDILVTALGTGIIKGKILKNAVK